MRIDIILQNNRDTEHRPNILTSSKLPVQRIGDMQGIRIHHNNRIQPGTTLVDFPDAIDVKLHDFPDGVCPIPVPLLNLRNRDFIQLKPPNVFRCIIYLAGKEIE